MRLVDLEKETGLHGNTLRGHLTALVERQRVTKIVIRHQGRGRPAWGYVARESEYAALALALAEGLDAANVEALDPTAVHAGRGWGERLRDQLALGDLPDHRERVLLALTHTGFAPRIVGEEIGLTACPLLAAARAHPSVVCAVHLGLVEGVTGRAGASLRPRPDTLDCRVVLP